MQNQNHAEFYTLEDLARLFGVHKNTVRRWRSSGAIPEPISINSQSLFWRRDTFESFLKSKEARIDA